MSSNLDVGPFGGGNTAVFQDVRANGISGQTITSSPTVMNLNTTVIARPWHGALSSNQIPLDAGKYRIDIIDTCTADDASANNIQYSIRDTGLNHLGGYKINANSDGSSYFAFNTSGSFYFELTDDKSVEVIVKVQGASNYPRGSNSNGSNEYYQQLHITKVG